MYVDLLYLFYFLVIKVADLKPGTRGHNLIVKVADVKMVVDKTRNDGSKVRVAECLIGDETGVIIFTARNGNNNI